MAKTRQVALIVDVTSHYHQQITWGVAAYLQEMGDWSLYAEEDPLEKLPDLRTWHGDGIIAQFGDRKVAAAVTGLKIPVLGIEGGYGWYDQGSQIPYFVTDNRAIARLAAEHLIDRGFTRFAYCGFPRTRTSQWSEHREVAFARHVQEAGFPCSVYTGRWSTSRKWAQLQRGLSAWLKSLKKPLGLMACNDARARHVLEACRTIDLGVPEDVAVVGVDNDPMMCKLARPPLTSVEQGGERLGYQAAALLDRLMASEKAPQLETFIEPKGLVVRRSSDTLAFEDADVTTALQFIREHAGDKIRLSDVAEAVQLSLSTLQARLKATIGRTIHAEIRRVRIEWAKQLLATTDLELKQIATQAGFAHVQHMTNTFRQHVGHTPAEHRRGLRAGSS